MSKKRKKKESIVIFEDWIKYARCLNDNEFRQLVNYIFVYYQTQQPPEFEGMLMEVWNDILPDLEVNVNKLQNKREVVAINREKRKLKTNANTNVNTNANTNANTTPKINGNTTPKTTGMVDGRWDMVDGRLEMEDRNVAMGDEEMEIRRLKGEGKSFSELFEMFPHTESLKQIYFE